MVIAALNPYPCGYHGHPVKDCTSPPAIATRCQKRTPVPPPDRIGSHVEVARLARERLSDGWLAELWEWSPESEKGVDRAPPGMRGQA